MINLTKLVLKRPVTTVLCIISLAFFGAISIFNMKLELTPDINMPMLIVTTTYAGANPEDIDELVTKEIEEEIGTLSGVDSITSSSNENYSMILLQYEYGTDMNNAYSELRKKLDTVEADLPDDADEPRIIEMNINEMASLYVCINNPGINNIYNYAKDTISPELEKISSVASVDIYGGQQEYVRVQLDPEKLSQLHLNMSDVASIVGAASFSVPAGSTDVGNTEMNISLGVKYKTPDELKSIPISYGSGSIIYLEDIAEVSRANDELTNIGRYNGEDAVILAIGKSQQYSASSLSRSVHKTFDKLQAADPNFEYTIVQDAANDINSSLTSVFETMIVAIILSTIVLYLFYGDIKASLIVATSIPISILSALVMMGCMGYSLNVITLGSMVLAVGMMVDNSIVVLEACFRAQEVDPDTSRAGYIRNAINGTASVAGSVLGSTVTTCVVFLPIGFLSGLSGQFFQPLGMTIVFSMIASLISAMTVVPLCFVFYKPTEKEKAPVYRSVRNLQDAYRSVESKILNNKRKAVLITGAFVVLALISATQLGMKLMPEIDQGKVQVSATLKPGLTTEKQLEKFIEIEQAISDDEDVEKLMLSSGSMSYSSSGTGTFVAYLKKDRVKTTDETVELWKQRLQYIADCDLSVEQYSQTAMMNTSSGYTLTLVSSDYDELKAVSDDIYDALKTDNRITAVSSSLANAAPVIKFEIDPVAAAAEGFVPKQLAGSLYTMLSGKEADKMDVDGQNLSIKVEYPDDEFDDINKVKDILLTSASGNTVYLKDIAELKFEDSPASIRRYDRQYQATISASYTDLANRHTEAALNELYVSSKLTGGVELSVNAQMEMMYDEFKSLAMAIVIAIFLVFVVMAAQFESPRFSFMVMTTIPFAMIGACGFLWLLDIDISMPTLIGFLMLIGTVVNNGILYVDTVDQLRNEMSFTDAVIEGGAIRLRPIMMTTLTTILSMLPMGIGYGDSGELMQGLALVNIGGLLTSTVLALLVLPVYYCIMNGRRRGYNA